MTRKHTVLAGAAALAALAALTIDPIAAQGSREIINVGGGAVTQDIRMATEQVLSGARLTPMPMGNGVIVGQVTDAGGKQAIPGALVTLSLPGSQPVRAMADPEGRFAFRDLPKGRFSLTTSKPGYVDGAYGRLRPSGPTQSLELSDNDRDASIAILMWRYASIAGTIVDEHGEPVIGAQVRALRRSFVAGMPKLTNASTDATDDRGVFRIGMLEPAEYVVAVVMSQTTGIEPIMLGGGGGGAMFEVAARAAAVEPMMMMLPDRGSSADAGVGADGKPLSYQTLFYPGTTASARATAIPVASGDDRGGIDFQLRPVRAARIAGRVSGPEGPVPHTTVSLLPADSEGLVSPIETSTTFTDGNGAFTFPAIPPGQYSLRVVRSPQMGMRVGPDDVMVQAGNTMTVTRVVTAGPGAAAPPPPTEPTLWAEVPVTVGTNDVADVEIPLRAGARIRGEVQFSGSAERPTPDRLLAISVTLEPADGRTGTPFLRGRVESNGTFMTASVAPGKYLLRVAGAPQGWTFRGATAAGRDVADAPIEIEASDVTGVIVTFTDRPTEITGTVTSDGTAPEATSTVIVFPADREAWLNYGTNPRRLRNVRADKTGAFSISNLPPGDYLIAAVRESSASDWQNPKFLEALSQNARRVQLADGQKVSQSLRVVR